MSRRKNWLATCSGWTRSCSYFSFAIKRDRTTVFAVFKIADGFLSTTQDTSQLIIAIWQVYQISTLRNGGFLVQVSNTFEKISVDQALKAAEFDSSRVREASYADFKNTHLSHNPQRYFSMTSSRIKSWKPSVLYRRPRRWQRARPQKLFCALIEIVCADDHYCWKPHFTNARCVKVPRP